MKTLSKAVILERNHVGMVMKERNLLARLHCPQLVNMHYAFQDARNLYIVMDVCLGGDLHYQLTHSPNKAFTEQQARFYCASIIVCLEYMHSVEVIHRDVKPENLLLDSRGQVKVTDLGISMELTDGVCTSTSGTRPYMAPEIFMSGHKHTAVADFYSLGITSYQFLLGQRPYRPDTGNMKAIVRMATFVPPEKYSDIRQIRRILMAAQERKAPSAEFHYSKKLAKFSPEARDFVTQCLICNPRYRLGSHGISELMSHPWFAGMDWDAMRRQEIPAPFRPDTSKANCAISNDDLQQMILNEEEQEVGPEIPAADQAKFIGYDYRTRVHDHESGRNERLPRTLASPPSNNSIATVSVAATTEVHGSFAMSHLRGFSSSGIYNNANTYAQTGASSTAAGTGVVSQASARADLTRQLLQPNGGTSNSPTPAVSGVNSTAGGAAAANAGNSNNAQMHGQAQGVWHQGSGGTRVASPVPGPGSQAQHNTGGGSSRNSGAGGSAGGAQPPSGPPPPSTSGFGNGQQQLPGAVASASTSAQSGGQARVGGGHVSTTSQRLVQHASQGSVDGPMQSRSVPAWQGAHSSLERRTTGDNGEVLSGRGMLADNNNTILFSASSMPVFAQQVVGNSIASMTSMIASPSRYSLPGQSARALYGSPGGGPPGTPNNNNSSVNGPVDALTFGVGPPLHSSGSNDVPEGPSPVVQMVRSADGLMRRSSNGRPDQQQQQQPPGYFSSQTPQQSGGWMQASQQQQQQQAYHQHIDGGGSGAAGTSARPIDAQPASMGDLQQSVVASSAGVGSVSGAGGVAPELGTGRDRSISTNPIVRRISQARATPVGRTNVADASIQEENSGDLKHGETTPAPGILPGTSIAVGASASSSQFYDPPAADEQRNQQQHQQPGQQVLRPALSGSLESDHNRNNDDQTATPPMHTPRGSETGVGGNGSNSNLGSPVAMVQGFRSDGAQVISHNGDGAFASSASPRKSAAGVRALIDVDAAGSGGDDQNGAADFALPGGVT